MWLGGEISLIKSVNTSYQKHGDPKISSIKFFNLTKRFIEFILHKKNIKFSKTEKIYF